MTHRLWLLLPFTVAATTALAGSDAPPVPFEKDSAWGYRDAAKKIVIAPRFRLAEAFVVGGHIAPVLDAEGFAWIDRRGEVVARPFVFDNGADPFAGGLTRVVDKDKRVGFMDATGKIVIPPRFAFARPFSDERAAFCEGCRAVKDQGGEHTFIEGGKWGYIDRRGNVIIAPTFDEAPDFAAGRARVRLGAVWTTLDRAGKTVADKPQK